MPEPLSLMPGPGGHGVEVRADDDDAVRVAARVSAITLYVVRVSLNVSRLDVQRTVGRRAAASGVNARARR